MPILLFRNFSKFGSTFLLALLPRISTLGSPALALIAVLCAPPCPAETLVLPPTDVDVVGEIRVTPARQNDTLLDIARRFDIGQDEIVLANPEVDRWLPREGTEVVIPARYVLPQAERRGIVLNVPEMRLYYFPAEQPVLPALMHTYPVSIGRMDWATPLGVTRVTTKTENPSWRPPQSIREEAEARGEPLPELIPQGPNNPLGNYALRLGLPGYLIHSTNKPFGVGMRVTHGCVRMYPEDIEILFPSVPVGTPVQIVDQPIKIGWLFDTLFIEVHPPLEEKHQDPDVLVASAMDLINAAWEQRPLVLDGQALKKALQEQSGIPVAIARSVRD
jgi:L,D-transpeptidase ErfK/SrfK